MALTEHNGALVPVSEHDAALTYKVATNAATLCGQIVKATAQSIQGRKYVKVEGWLAIAAAHGCLVSIREVRMIEGGVMAVASGHSGAATASGYSGAATASGHYGAATASGHYGKARGKDGCALFLCERDRNWKIVNVWAGIVGRDGIKPDTFYMLKGGKPVEV